MSADIVVGGFRVGGTERDCRTHEGVPPARDGSSIRGSNFPAPVLLGVVFLIAVFPADARTALHALGDVLERRVPLLLSSARVVDVLR